MYHSTTVLGQMYDRVLAHPITKQLMGADRQDSSSNSSGATASSSASLLGRIALSQQQQQHASGANATATDFHSCQWPEQLLQVPKAAGWAVFVQEAEQHFAEFEREVVGIMNHWNVYDLGELCR